MLPKTSAYVKSYDGQIKWMYTLIEDGALLEKIFHLPYTSAKVKFASNGTQ